MASNIQLPTVEKPVAITIDGLAYGLIAKGTGTQEPLSATLAIVVEKEGQKTASSTIPIYITSPEPLVYLMNLQSVVPLEDYGFEGKIIPANSEIQVSAMTESQFQTFVQSDYTFLPLLKSTKITQETGLILNRETGEYSIDRFHIEEGITELIFWMAVPPLSLIGDTDLTCNPTNITLPFGTYRNLPIHVTDSGITSTSYKVVISGIVKNITGLKDKNIKIYNTEQEFTSENIKVDKKVVDNLSFSAEQIEFIQNTEDLVYRFDFNQGQEGSWFDFVKGVDYIVTWDGVEYDIPCQVTDNNFSTYLGNPALMPGSTMEATDYPFCIYNTYTDTSNSTTYTYVSGQAATTQEGTHTFSFHTKAEEYEATRGFLEQLVKKNTQQLSLTQLGNDFSFSLSVPFSTTENYQNTFLYIVPSSDEESAKARILIRAMTYIPQSSEGGGDGSANPCLAAETLISMADGTKKQMKDIKVGEKVLSRDGKISSVYQVKNEPGYKQHTLYTFEDGTVIDETGPHAFFCVERGYYLMLDQWKIGEHALSSLGQEIALLSKESIPEPKHRYGIFVEEGNYYANGLLSGQVVLNTENVEEMDILEVAQMFNSFDYAKLCKAISI